MYVSQQSCWQVRITEIKVDKQKKKENEKKKTKEERIIRIIDRNHLKRILKKNHKEEEINYIKYSRSLRCASDRSPIVSSRSDERILWKQRQQKAIIRWNNICHGVMTSSTEFISNRLVKTSNKVSSLPQVLDERAPAGVPKQGRGRINCVGPDLGSAHTLSECTCNERRGWQRPPVYTHVRG